MNYEIYKVCKSQPSLNESCDKQKHTNNNNNHSSFQINLLCLILQPVESKTKQDAVHKYVRVPEKLKSAKIPWTTFVNQNSLNSFWKWKVLEKTHSILKWCEGLMHYSVSKGTPINWHIKDKFWRLVNLWSLVNVENLPRLIIWVCWMFHVW